jgi:hypothetical protein
VETRPRPSRTSTSWLPRIGSRAIFLATVVPPEPASRSTHVRTRKWVSAVRAAQNNSKMSPSRSPTWTHRAGAPSWVVACLRLSSQRTRSFCSIGTRVGFTRFFRALVPLNFRRVQNLTAARPSGTPAVVTTRLECRSSPQTVWRACRPLISDSLPISSGAARWKLNSVVSCNTRTGPAVAANRPVVAAKWPARITPSSTRRLSKNR